MKSSVVVFVSLFLAFGLTGCFRSENSSNAKTIEITTDKLRVKMVLIPGGRFMMGSDTGASDESPRHEVELSPFAIDKYEVTQVQFATLEIPDPSQFKDAKRPVEQIRWSDAALFCNERSLFEGLEPCYDPSKQFACNFKASGYRLPTEAEWEYAARAGANGDFGPAATAGQLKNYACYAPTSTKKTDLVGRKKPNAWGLHDMLGNVREWCHDIYSPTYYQMGPTKDPRGAASSKKRVMRGGAWNSSESGCRVTTRYAEIPGITDACFARNTFGFRCVRRLTDDELERLQSANASK